MEEFELLFNILNQYFMTILSLLMVAPTNTFPFRLGSFNKRTASKAAIAPSFQKGFRFFLTQSLMLIYTETLNTKKSSLVPFLTDRTQQEPLSLTSLFTKKLYLCFGAH